MANPRQRRKARSSTHRAVSHSKHAKRNLKKTPPIRGPKVLQDAWDSQLTVRQNYVNLGLVVTLDPSAHGGVEKPLGAEASSMQVDEQDSAPVASSSKSASTSVPSGFGKIIRDAAGNILRIELNEEEDAQQEKEPETIDMEEDLESRMDQSVREKWATDFSRSTAPQMGPSNGGVVHKLEQFSVSSTGTGKNTLSLPISGAGARHASSGEVRYLVGLVKKYGANVDAMAGDLKLNPEQKTVGQLRRALKKANLLA